MAGWRFCRRSPERLHGQLGFNLSTSASDGGPKAAALNVLGTPRDEWALATPTASRDCATAFWLALGVHTRLARRRSASRPAIHDRENARDRKERDQQQGEQHGTTDQPTQQDGLLDLLSSSVRVPPPISQMLALSEGHPGPSRALVGRGAYAIDPKEWQRSLLSIAAREVGFAVTTLNLLRATGDQRAEGRL
jgi:hypothetical protein